jgi:hypothetical protein
MIVSNLVTSFLQLIFKPKIWVPLLAMLVISLAVTQAMSIILEQPMLDIILYPDMFPSENIMSVFLTQYPIQILSSLVMAFLMTVLGIVALSSTARMSQGEGLISAINNSMKEIQKAIGIAIIFWATLLFALLILTIIGAIAGISEIIGLILLFIYMIIILLILIKTVFVFPALNENEIKEAFKKSWIFTQKKFWKATLYLVLVGLISIIVGGIIYSAGLLFAGNILELVILAIGETFTSVYFIVSITNYFYSKQ